MAENQTTPETGLDVHRQEKQAAVRMLWTLAGTKLRDDHVLAIEGAQGDSFYDNRTRLQREIMLTGEYDGRKVRIGLSTWVYKQDLTRSNIADSNDMIVAWLDEETGEIRSIRMRVGATGYENTTTGFNKGPMTPERETAWNNGETPTAFFRQPLLSTDGGSWKDVVPQFLPMLAHVISHGEIDTQTTQHVAEKVQRNYGGHVVVAQAIPRAEEAS